MNDFDRMFSLSGLSLDRLRSFLMVAEAGNLAKAAKGDATRQSQYSRQVKELEGFFGVTLTRRVGRRIEITPEGMRLAGLVRRHFSELDDFREAMNNRPVRVRVGSQGSLLDWLVVPRLAVCREALGGAVIELEQLGSENVVRGVADGRLDFGIVREDALEAGMKCRVIGRIGYAVFAPKAAWKRGAKVEDVLRGHPTGELLPGGQFGGFYQDWLAQQGIAPEVIVRVPSFVLLARLARENGLAAVLPQIAREDLDASRFPSQPMPWKYDRRIVLVANDRNLERTGMKAGAMDRLFKALVSGSPHPMP